MNDRSHKRKLDSVIDPASKKKATVEDDRWIFDTEEPDYKPVESLKGSLLPDPAKRGKIYCRDRNVDIRHCLFGYKIDSCPNLLEHTIYMQSRSIMNNAIQGSDVICTVVTKALLKQPNGAWPPYYFDLRHAEDLTNGSIRRIQEKATELYGYGSPVVLCNEITPALRLMADGLRRTVCQYTTPLLSNATETIKEFRLAVKSYAQEVHYRCPMFAIKADLLDALDAENILLSGLDSTGPGLWKFDRVVYVTDATALMPPLPLTAHMTLRTEQAVHVSLGIGNICADAIVRVVRLLKGETSRECEWDDMPYIKQDPATTTTIATNTALEVVPTDAESDYECRTHHSDISLLADTLVFDETTVDLSIDNDSHAAAPAAPQSITTLSRAEQALRVRIAALQAQRATLLARQLHNRQHNTTEPLNTFDQTTGSTSAGNGRHTVPHHHRSKTSALAAARPITTKPALATSTTSRNSTSDPKNNDATTTTVTTTTTTPTTTTATLSAIHQELRDSRRPGQPHPTIARSPQPVSLSVPQDAAPPPARKSADRASPAPTTTATTDSNKTLDTTATVTTSTRTTAISTNTTTTSGTTPMATLTLVPTILTAPTTRTSDKVCNDSDSSLSRVPDSPTTALRQAGNTIRDSKWVKVKFSGTLPAASGVSSVPSADSTTPSCSTISSTTLSSSTAVPTSTPAPMGNAPVATALLNTVSATLTNASTNRSTKPPSPTSTPTGTSVSTTTTTTTTTIIPVTATTTTPTNTSTPVTTNSINSSQSNEIPKKVARQYVPKPKDEILPLTMPITASATFCSTTAEVLHTGTAATATTTPTVTTTTTNNTTSTTNTLNTLTTPTVHYIHHKTTGMHLYTTTEEDMQRLQDFAEVSIPDSLQAELRALPAVVVTRRAPPPGDLTPGTVYVELNDDTIPVGEFYHAVRKQLGLE